MTGLDHENNQEIRRNSGRSPPNCSKVNGHVGTRGSQNNEGEKGRLNQKHNQHEKTKTDLRVESTAMGGGVGIDSLRTAKVLKKAGV